MKRVLSLLLAYTLVQSQSWAIGGGPNSSSDYTALVGTYSGVMLPSGDNSNFNNGTTTVEQTTSTSIGLFSLAVPSTGVATGSAVVFVEGVAYIGDMVGVADPKDNTLDGIIEAQSNYDVVTLIPVIDANGNVTYTESTSKIFAQGNVKAKIKQSGTPDPVLGLPVGSIRIDGSAQMDLFTTLNSDGTPDINSTVEFSVDGFKQSDTATTVTITLNVDVTNTDNTTN